MTKSCCWLNLVKLVSLVLFEHREQGGRVFHWQNKWKETHKRVCTMYNRTYAILLLRNN